MLKPWFEALSRWCWPAHACCPSRTRSIYTWTDDTGRVNLATSRRPKASR
jgi:hypothetical protein